MFAFLVAASVGFNFSKCPGPSELMAPGVEESFSPQTLVGTYYEVVLHDYTQTACPEPRCIRSVKGFNQSGGYVSDHFTLQCYGGSYPSEFIFSQTGLNGYFEGKVVGLPGVYPDTFVAISPQQAVVTGKSQYQWVIEFQCLDKEEEVYFVGINFYCYTPHPTQPLLDEMLQAAYAQGLGTYLNKSMLYVNQTDCTYP